jgi:hypothetical protein
MLAELWNEPGPQRLQETLKLRIKKPVLVHFDGHRGTSGELQLLGTQPSLSHGLCCSSTPEIQDARQGSPWDGMMLFHQKIGGHKNKC